MGNSRTRTSVAMLVAPAAAKAAFRLPHVPLRVGFQLRASGRHNRKPSRMTCAPQATEITMQTIAVIRNALVTKIRR